MVGRLYTQYSRSEIYGFEMMKIENKTGRRILIGGRDLPLHTYCNNDNVWFWYIYTKKEVIPGLFSKSGEYFKLFLEMGRKYSYPAYESRMYCIYLGYKYEVENIWHGLFILSPNERKTRRHLKLNDHDDSRIEVPYEEFIASSPIIWEERKPISDFVFDVEPLVYLFKDDSYIEENLHGAWQTEYQIRKMNKGCIRYSSIAILLLTILLLSCRYSHILSLLY